MKKVKGCPQPFGAVVEGRKVNIAVQVPSGKECLLLLYEAGKNVPEYRFEMPEEEGIGEVRFLALEDIAPADYEYNFLIGGKVCVDPYVKEIAGRECFGKKRDPEKHEIRGKLVSEEYDWEEDCHPRIPWNEVIAYSLHVRGFTKHSSSRAVHKGTYKGVMEKIPYLKELGINQIQCMPVYEFDDCPGEKVNYWGYGTGYFFAPKESYAAGKSAVCELKDMVKACHRAGIEVVFEMPFDQGVPVQMMVECLRFYMLEYHADGFVVNPYIIPWDLLHEDPFLKGVKLIRRDEGFQTVMRRFLKGDENMIYDVIWALKHNSATDGVCNTITSQTGFTLWDLVSYDGKHNEENGERNVDGPDYNYSWNCGAEGPTRKKAVIALRRNQVRNAFQLLLTAQGTPCILAGDEFFNSQNGNNNVYCQDNETGWVNWGKLKTDDSLFRYVKELIQFRKRHGCMHCAEELRGLDKSACGLPDISFHGESAWQIKSDVASRQLAVMYAGQGEETCFAAYNMHWLPHKFALPSPGKGRKWYLVSDGKRGMLESPECLENQKEIDLEERSIILLEGKECLEEKKMERKKRDAQKASNRKNEKKEKESEKGNESSQTLLHYNEAQNAGHEKVFSDRAVPTGDFA